MTILYRIKPLEWEDLGDWWLSYSYSIRKYSENSFELRYAHRHVSGNKSLEEAKERAESHHRRKLLEAELEPACQPTTELPTEPGLYWWRDAISRWIPSKVFWESGRLLASRGTIADPVEDLKGQWIRIPEPEVQP